MGCLPQSPSHGMSQHIQPFSAAVFITISNTIAEKMCNAGGKEDESDANDTMCAEKTLLLIKTASFYGSGRLVKEGILTWQFVKTHTTLFACLYMIVAVILVIALEKFQNIFIAKKTESEGHQSPGVIARKKIANEHMALASRTLSWMGSGFISTAFLPAMTSRWHWIFAACFFQVIAVLLEIHRIRHVQTKMIDPHLESSRQRSGASTERGSTRGSIQSGGQVRNIELANAEGLEGKPAAALLCEREPDAPAQVQLPQITLQQDQKLDEDSFLSTDIDLGCPSFLSK